MKILNPMLNGERMTGHQKRWDHATRLMVTITLIFGRFAFKCAICITACASGVMAQTLPAQRTPHLAVSTSPDHPDVVVMEWRGAVQAPMSAEIGSAYEHYRAQARGFVLRLDSNGGSVAEGERVIEVLARLKETNKLNTSVGAGNKCASMCVFIYAQGQRRFAAPASLWLFHEVSFVNPKTHLVERLDRKAWETLVEKYWIPAGVNPIWIDQVKAHTNGRDYWEAGATLLRDRSNLVSAPLSDVKVRVVHAAQ
jgi:hypothetical protein